MVMGNNAEVEFWEVQDLEELKSLMAEADAFGLDALDIVVEAAAAYPRIKRAGFNRALVDAGVLSERDAARRALRNAIRRVVR
jgi:hypothetical protein